MIDHIKRSDLHGFIAEGVELGSTVVTDDFKSYRKLTDYQHETVEHSVGEYVKGQAHVNGIVLVDVQKSA